MTICSEKSGSSLVTESAWKIAVCDVKIEGDENHTEMPSAGTRRTTRVVVKGDRARVLRSGRRLFPVFAETKPREDEEDNDCLNPPEKKESDVAVDRGNEHDSDAQSYLKQAEVMGVDEKDDAPGTVESDILDGGSRMGIDKMHGIVYSRKRKLVRREAKCDLETSETELENKMYGIVYTRKRWKKNNYDGRSLATVNNFDVKMRSQQQGMSPGFVLSVLVESSAGSGNTRGSFISFLCSVLMYLRRRTVPMIQLFKFLTSEPLDGLYSLQGIRLLQGPPSSNRTGICKIFGARRFTPLFTVDFSAVPLCFMYMHSSMILRYRCPQDFFVNISVGGHPGHLVVNGSDVRYTFMPTQSDSDGKILGPAVDGGSNMQCAAKLPLSDLDGKILAPVVVNGSDMPADIDSIGKNLASALDNAGNNSALHPSIRSTKVVGRISSYRAALSSRTTQKRRSSLRSRRGRNPASVSIDRSRGSLVSDLISRKKNGIPFSSVASYKDKLRGSVNRSSSGNLDEPSSVLVASTKGTDPSCCSGNLLVIESDKCYREEGFSIMLEMSDSGDWVLAIKRDGLTRYTHKAQKVMMPGSSNRLTNAMVWTTDSGWKMEFTSRQEWMIFRELYKKCYDRNVLLSSTKKAIPVPGVHEVSSYQDSNVSFYRPDAYITMNSDEVSRALARTTANYDMDSEDEEWLKKFNTEFYGENSVQEQLTEDGFELIIDAFEKANYTSQNNFTVENAVAKFCYLLGHKEAVQALYSYWMKKRKQKRSALFRIFQIHLPKKSPAISKAGPRKRRALKRQASQTAKDRQQKENLLQAAVAERISEEQKAIKRCEQAITKSNRSTKQAIVSRKRAQELMNTAELAAYRATMAYRIAEAARLVESSDAAARHYLEYE